MKKNLFDATVGRKSVLVLLVFLTFSVVICGSRGSTSEPTISVNPREPTNDGRLILDIAISDVTDLGGYEFKLKYDSNVLMPIDITIVDDPEFFYDHHIFHRGVHGPDSHIWLVVTLPLGAVDSVSGSGTITTIEFIVRAPAETALELYDTILGNLDAEAIEHISVDAHVHLVNTWQGEYVPMCPSRVFSVEIDGVDFDVITHSNSTLSEFDFSRSWNSMKLLVEGTDNTYGYLDLEIPKELLSGSLSVTVDGTPVDFTIDRKCHTLLPTPHVQS